MVGNRKNRSLVPFALFGLHGLPAWIPQSPKSTAQYANVFLYVKFVLLIQSEKRERAHVHNMSTIGVSEPMGSTPGDQHTPNPPVRGQSLWWRCLTCKKFSFTYCNARKNGCDKICHLQTSLDSLTEQIGSPWAPSNPGITAYRNKSD